MPGTDTEWKMGAKTCSGLVPVSGQSATTRSSRWHAASSTRGVSSTVQLAAATDAAADAADETGGCARDGGGGG